MNLEKIKVIDSSSLEFIEQKRRSKCSVYAPGAQKKIFWLSSRTPRISFNVMSKTYLIKIGYLFKMLYLIINRL